jgi:hypothetical protein
MSTERISSDGVLAKLLHQQLSAVTFVQDYVQLSFDGLRLTLNVWPIINASRSFGDSGYRDELCSLIGRTVVQVREEPGAIDIVFDEGCLRIDLQSESSIERVIFENTVTAEWAWW